MPENKTNTQKTTTLNCLRSPVPEIFDAARYLDASVSAHIAGKVELAKELIELANIPEIRDWVESLWGKISPYVKFREIQNSPITLPKEKRVEVRMPTTEEKNSLHERDGYHCRFCGIPVLRKEIRIKLHKLYPTVLPWGRKNIEQHPAFQAMWLQYDHILPHSRGGNNDLDNIVITCAPCNFARMERLVEEVGLTNPLNHEPVKSTWDGLERLLLA